MDDNYYENLVYDYEREQQINYDISNETCCNDNVMMNKRCQCNIPYRGYEYEHDNDNYIHYDIPIPAGMDIPFDVDD